MDLPIRLGLCCHNLTLRYDDGVFTGRTLRLDTVKKNGVKILIEVANKNLDDLKKIIQWNVDHDIYLYRISSEIIPHVSNLKLLDYLSEEEFESYYELKPFVEKLKEIGELIKKTGIRVTFHPGQYNQIGTNREDVFMKTKMDLYMHARFLELIGDPKDAIMIIHGGGTYGDKKETMKRWIKQFAELPEIVKKYIVIENDETCYSATDAIYLAEQVNIPFIHDVFHHQCYDKYKPEDKQISMEKAVKKSIDIWQKHGKRPKFHLSEQGNGSIIGTHSTIVKTMPFYLFDVYKNCNVKIDVMIEAKGKEVALAYLYNKYPEIRPEKAKNIPTKIPYKARNDIRIDDNEYLCQK